MASSIQLLRSTNPQERPFAGNLLEGQPAANLHSSEPGLFFKTTDGSIVKFGPAAITSDGSPPNSTPQGSSGNSVGELWLDKSVDPAVLKVYDGAQWVDAGSGGGGGGGGGSGAFVRWIYTAIGGETSLSGTSGGVLLDYTPGLEEVYVNGVLITRGVDYSATNGTSITNLAALTTGDVVTVLSMNPIETVQLPGQVTLLRWTILAAAGQTVLSGIDSSSQQLAYTAGFEEVYVNGAFLRRGVDYTATDGSTITISSPLTEDDEVTVMAWSEIEIGSLSIKNEDVAADAAISSSKLSFFRSLPNFQARSVQSKLGDVLNVRDFGAVGDGSTNDAQAFISAFAALTENSSLIIPAGRYVLNTSSLDSSSLLIPANGVSILGEGKTATIVELTGSGQRPLFQSSNKNRVLISGINFKGNNISSGFSSAGTAIWIAFGNGGETPEDGDISVLDCSFENFAGPYWCSVQNLRTASTSPVRNVRFSGLSCKGGSDPNPTSIGQAARQIGLASTSGGLVEDVIINDCYCDAYNVKMGIALQGDFRNVTIDSCIVKRAGQADAISDTSRYAFMLYNGIQQASITNCIAEDPYDVGFYLLNTFGCSISNCYISGQVSSADGTLNKGGIAVAQGTTVISNCHFKDNFYHITIQAPGGANVGTTLVTGCYFENGLCKVRQTVGGAGSGAEGGGFSSNVFKDTKILFQANLGVDFLWKNFLIQGNSFFSSKALDTFIQGHLYDGFSRIQVRDNVFSTGTGPVTRAINGADGVIFRRGFVVEGNLFEGEFVDGAVILGGCFDGFTISNNRFRDITTATAVLRLSNCIGVASGNTFFNCTVPLVQPTGNNDMCLEAPSWNGELGERIQVLSGNLNSYYAWNTGTSTWQLVTEW